MHLDALVNFLNRPWFRRGWIFQEAALCNSIIFLIDDKEVEGLGILDSLATAISTIDGKRDQFKRFSDSLGFQGLVDLNCERTER
jgi:hypothetical protein